METVEGYEMSSWSRGYGDFEMTPDMDTLRPIPWHEGTVLLMADIDWHDGSDVVASPRQILRKQLARLAERGWRAFAGTELEFIVFTDTYEEAWHKAYRDLEPTNLYNVDYSMLGTARVEPLIRRIRNTMMGAGMMVENSKGECNFGQHEINFHYDEALAACDDHVIYKNGAKEIAVAGGLRDHVHGEVQRARGQLVPHPLLAGRRRRDERLRRGRGPVQQVPGGPARMPARDDPVLRPADQLLQALRARARSRRPRSRGARTTAPARCGSSGHGRARRVENRLPGADVNPYLALAAMIAAGLHGIDNELELEDPLAGNAYESDKPHVPHTMYAARDLFAESDVAKEAFGQEVVDHYLNRARIELEAIRGRGHRLGALPGFERL